MLAGVIENLIKGMRSYSYSAKELEDLKRRKLARSLRWAYGHVPLYHSWFRSIGKAPEDLPGVEGLAQLPMLSRERLVENYRDGITVKGMRPTVTWATTGTTGKPMRIEWTREMVEVRQAVSLRRMLKFGVLPWHRIAAIWPPRVTWRYAYDDKGKRRVSTAYRELPLTSAFGRPIPTVKILVSTPGDPVGELRTLCRLRPDFVVCRASHLRRLGERLGEDGLEMSPKGLFMSWEEITSASKKAIESSFNASTCRIYGSTEFGGIGGDCRARRGMHLYEDFLIAEVVKDDEQVGPGEMGELVLTSLHNDLMPLIRYRTGDLVELADGDRCDCGSNLIRVDSVQGRLDDGLVTADGTRLPVLQTAERVERETGLHDFQLNQVSIDKIVVRLPSGRTTGSEVEARLGELLSRMVGNHVEVAFEERSEEELWSKTRPVISAIR